MLFFSLYSDFPAFLFLLWEECALSIVCVSPFYPQVQSYKKYEEVSVKRDDSNGAEVGCRLPAAEARLGGERAVARRESCLEGAEAAGACGSPLRWEASERHDGRATLTESRRGARLRARSAARRRECTAGQELP